MKLHSSHLLLLGIGVALGLMFSYLSGRKSDLSELVEMLDDGSYFTGNEYHEKPTWVSGFGAVGDSQYEASRTLVGYYEGRERFVLVFLNRSQEDNFSPIVALVVRRDPRGTSDRYRWYFSSQEEFGRKVSELQQRDFLDGSDR